MTEAELALMQLWEAHDATFGPMFRAQNETARGALTEARERTLAAALRHGELLHMQANAQASTRGDECA